MPIKMKIIFLSEKKCIPSKFSVPQSIGDVSNEMLWTAAL